MNRNEGMALVGFVVMGAGFWMAWPPLGLILPGALLFLAATLRHLRGG